METIKIKIHSYIDLITNSSTEMFVVDQNYGIDVIKEAIEEFGQKHVGVYVHELGTYDWELDEHVDYLKKRGYKIIEPMRGFKAHEIHISAERGSMSDAFKKFILETFNGEYSDNG